MTQEQASDDRDALRATQFRAGAAAERHRAGLGTGSVSGSADEEMQGTVPFGGPPQTVRMQARAFADRACPSTLPLAALLCAERLSKSMTGEPGRPDWCAGWRLLAPP